MQICENPPCAAEPTSQVDLDLQLCEIREHIRRARRIVEDQRSRIRRVRADARSIGLHEHLCHLFERSLAHMEKYERVLKAELARARGQLQESEAGDDEIGPACAGAQALPGTAVRA